MQPNWTAGKKKKHSQLETMLPTFLQDLYFGDGNRSVTLKTDWHLAFYFSVKPHRSLYSGHSPFPGQQGAVRCSLVWPKESQTPISSGWRTAKSWRLGRTLSWQIITGKIRWLQTRAMTCALLLLPFFKSHADHLLIYCRSIPRDLLMMSMPFLPLPVLFFRT